MKSSYIYINDLRVHYLHWNLAGDKQPIIFLHGLASNAHIWEFVAENLSTRDYPLLAPEARGHGLTDKPENGYGFEVMTRDLSAFIQACNLDNPLLVGHSWGATIALDYAARHPFGPISPSGIVMVDGGMVQMDAMPDASWETIVERLAPPNLIGTPVETFHSNVKNWTSNWAPNSETSDRIASIYLASFQVDKEECIAPQLSYDRHMTILRAIWEFQTYNHYAQIHCPVLMVPAAPPTPGEREEQHTMMKRLGIERASDQIQNLQVHWMTDTVHDIPLQRPVVLAQLIADFADQIQIAG
jgi:pimeloyl-ACP methyl ester carboxylesterase